VGRAICSPKEKKRQTLSTNEIRIRKIVTNSNKERGGRACVSESGMERGYKKFPDVIGEEDGRESNFQGVSVTLWILVV
jgi:hypothetical protein